MDLLISENVSVCVKSGCSCSVQCCAQRGTSRPETFRAVSSTAQGGASLRGRARDVNTESHLGYTCSPTGIDEWCSWACGGHRLHGARTTTSGCQQARWHRCSSLWQSILSFTRFCRRPLSRIYGASSIPRFAQDLGPHTTSDHNEQTDVEVYAHTAPSSTGLGNYHSQVPRSIFETWCHRVDADHKFEKQSSW